MGRNNIKTSNGSSGHTGGTRPGQTWKKPKDLSVREREDRVCGITRLLFFFYTNTQQKKLLLINKNPLS